MIRRLLLVLAVCAGWGAPLTAQTIPTSPQTLTTQFSSTCTLTSCATWNVGTATSVTISVTGTFSGTITWEGSTDGITFFVISMVNLADGSSASTTTTTGQFAIANSGLQKIQARMTAFSSGGANVWAVRGYATARWLSPFLTRGYFGDGTKALPSISFASETSSGWYRAGAGDVRLSVLNTDRIAVGTTATDIKSPDGGGYFRVLNGDVQVNSAVLDIASGGTTQTTIVGDAANILALRNAANAQKFRIGPSTSYLTWDSAVGVTPAASQAAGGTVNDIGTLTRYRYQVTVAPAAGDCSTAFIAGATTADCTIATIPAGQKLVGVYADVTAGFTCSGTCTGTKVMTAGKTAGGTEILAANLNVAAPATYGLADTDLGSGMTRAAAIQEGYIGSWTTTTPVIVRFTSGTGNWGSGVATFVNAGSVKFTLVTEQVK